MSDSTPEYPVAENWVAPSAEIVRVAAWRRPARWLVATCLAGGWYALFLLVYGYLNGRFSILDRAGYKIVVAFSFGLPCVAVWLGLLLSRRRERGPRKGRAWVWGVPAFAGLLAVVVLRGIVAPPHHPTTCVEKELQSLVDSPLGEKVKGLIGDGNPDEEDQIFPLQSVPLLGRYLLYTYIDRPNEFLPARLVGRLMTFQAEPNEPGKWLEDIRQECTSLDESSSYLARCGPVAGPAILKEFEAAYAREKANGYRGSPCFKTLAWVLSAYPSPERDKILVDALDHSVEHLPSGWHSDSWFTGMVAELGENRCQDAVPVLQRLYEGMGGGRDPNRLQARLGLNRLGCPLQAGETTVTLPSEPPKGFTKAQMTDLHGLLAELADNDILENRTLHVDSVERNQYGGLTAVGEVLWQREWPKGTLNDERTRWTIHTGACDGRRVWVFWHYYHGDLSAGDGVSLFEKRNGRWLLIIHEQLGIA